jgi:peptidyl-prolyl cis-trans isomerase B (cyclophilin B)
MITLKTSFGDIRIELDEEKAPRTCANFRQYVEDGFYDGTIFHRVIDGFMIQGGGFQPGMIEKPTRGPIENEAANGLSNRVGTIAMARTMEPHSATAQFFINVSDNTFLDYPGQDGWGYCVFGRVTEGLDVVEKIKGVDTTTRVFHQDVPVEDVVIESARVSD